MISKFKLKKNRKSVPKIVGGSYEIGSTVNANWEGKGEYYQATIIKKNHDGTYNLKYHDDNIEEQNVQESFIIPISPRREGSNVLNRITPTLPISSEIISNDLKLYYYEYSQIPE